MGTRPSHPARTAHPIDPAPPSRLAKARAAAPTDPEPEGLNLAVLWGVCSTAAEVRELASGRRLVGLAVRTPVTPGRGGRPAVTGASAASAAQARATSVPVTVWDPPAWVEGLGEGDPVVVVGVVRRRFFVTASGRRGAKSRWRPSSSPAAPGPSSTGPGALRPGPSTHSRDLARATRGHAAGSGRSPGPGVPVGGGSGHRIRSGGWSQFVPGRPPRTRRQETRPRDP